MENRKGLAVIAARGGSKRIPRKNIKLFHGKPIMEYVIEACLESGCFEEVMVSTDDAEIAGIAKKCGAGVPFFRSPENSGDQAGIFSVLREVLKAYSDKGRRFTDVCCLLPTAPFITAEKLRTARINLRQNPGCSMVLPMVRFGFPIQRGIYLRNSRAEMVSPEHFATRSQDLEPCYHDAGQFYYFDVDTFENTPFPSFQGAAPVVYPETEVQDIDTEEDWKLAELKFSLLSKP